MRLNQIYECVDGRPGGKLSGVVMLRVFQGVFQPVGYGPTPHETIEVDDNLEDDHENDIVVLHLDAGKVYLTYLTKELFEATEGPTILDTPDFSSTAELQEWFRGRILDKMEGSG